MSTISPDSYSSPQTVRALTAGHPYRDQEAPQAHAQEEAQEAAEGHALAAPGRPLTAPDKKGDPVAPRPPF